MATETVAKPKTSARVHVQKFGTFLSGMIMPNIGAFIAWGLITALFIKTGWLPIPELGGFGTNAAGTPNVGVTLMLIAEPAAERNLELSTMTRDAMIFAVSAEQASGTPEDSGKSSVVVAAIALNAALQASHSDQLSSSELKLFLEWLHRISTSSTS